jgi:hypothetical protein
MAGGFSSAISDPTEIIAVSAEDLEKWGCPHCGYRSGSSMMSGGGSATWNCGECQRTTVALAPGINRSTISFGGEERLCPELQPHPRAGTPAHGQPDIRPDEGGEFFHSRRIGLDHTPACFVCGGDSPRMRSNIAAFVRTKEAGERIVGMFDQVRGGARLDYRNHEPDRVQVKVGACDDHLKRLEFLGSICQDGRITEERIQAAAVK